MAETESHYAATEPDLSTISSTTTTTTSTSTSTHSRFNNDEKREPPNHTSTGISLRRTISRRETILSRIRSRPPIGNFSHPLSHKQTTVEELVDFDGPDDPYRPLNWTLKKKVYTTVLYGFTTMGSTWASSVFSPGIGQIAEQFNVSTEVATLGLALLLLGFGVGPLLWAPLSEVYGRKTAVLTPYFIAACFSFGTATAKDIQTIMITRFFAGFFGSAPVTNTGGVLGDLYSPGQRGIAMAGYALAVVGGPVLGPIVGSAVVVQPFLRWRLVPLSPELRLSLPFSETVGRLQALQLNLLLCPCLYKSANLIQHY